jgi:DnaJ-class molecular chaperone
MEFHDYYKTLGVPKTASDAEIKKAYRKLARKHHPDLNPGDKAAEAKFKEVNEANEVLGDPDKRKKFDELGANWRQYEQQAEHAQQTGAPFAGAPFGGGGGAYRTVSPDEMEEMFGADHPFSDFFQTFFAGAQGPGPAGGARRSARPRRGRDLDQPVTLTLEEAFTGTTRHLAIKDDGHQRTVEIRIPAGVKEGARVRSAGEGEAAPPGGAAGDLFLSVHIEPHPRFERRGQDLHVRVGVPVTTAVLGGEVSAPSLSGSSLRLKIPPLTGTGRVFRLRAHGMPTVGKKDERGDLYATVDVTIPTALSDDARKLYEALRDLERKS